MTGVSLLIGNCMVPFFTHTGTLVSAAGFKLESHVEQIPSLGAFILVLYFTTAMRSCISLGHACKNEVSVYDRWDGHKETSLKDFRLGTSQMSCIMRKCVFGVSNQVRHKPDCTATIFRK